MFNFIKKLFYLDKCISCNNNLQEINKYDIKNYLKARKFFYGTNKHCGNCEIYYYIYKSKIVSYTFIYNEFQINCARLVSNEYQYEIHSKNFTTIKCYYKSEDNFEPIQKTKTYFKNYLRTQILK